MNTAISLSDPYGIYASEEVIDDLGIEQGAPVEISLEINEDLIDSIGPDLGTHTLNMEFDEAEFESSSTEELKDFIDSKTGEKQTVSTLDEIRPISEFDKEKELHSLFYGIYMGISDLSSEVQDNFRSILSKNQQEDPFRDSDIHISGKDDFDEYMKSIEQVNDSRFGDEELIIGCGHLDFLLHHPREDVIATPNFTLQKSLFDKILQLKHPDIKNITRFTGDIRQPDEVYFCTNTNYIGPEQRDSVKQRVLEQKYFKKGENYLFRYLDIDSHGPINQTDYDSETDCIMVTPSNISLTYVMQGHVHFDSPDFEDMSSDSIKAIIDNSELDDAMKPVQTAADLRFNLDGFEYLIYIGDGYFMYQILHPIDEQDREDAIDGLSEIMSVYEDEFDEESYYHANQKEPSSLSETQTWNFDTSAIYHQTKDAGADCIVDFLIKNYQLYQKNIRIPWQSLYEINKHKEESGSTYRASKQGLENINILKRLSDIGLISLDVQQLPSDDDFSVTKGLTDLYIVSETPDDAVLISGDDRLLEIADLVDCSANSVFELKGPTNSMECNEECWQSARDTLEDDPVPVNKLQTVIESSARHYLSSENVRDGYAEELITDWAQDDRIVRSYQDEELTASLTQVVSIVPTYELATELHNHLTEYNSGLYFTDQFLEEVRSSIGRLPKSQRPKIEFLIPERYIYLAQDTGQIGDLYQIEMAQNAHYKSISTDSDEEIRLLERAMTQTAKSQDAILLLKHDQSELYQMGRLLNIDMCKI
jgi:hypothetical protein